MPLTALRTALSRAIGADTLRQDYWRPIRLKPVLRDGLQANWEGRSEIADCRAPRLCTGVPDIALLDYSPDCLEAKIYQLDCRIPDYQLTIN
jgi:hypothetical protein